MNKILIYSSKELYDSASYEGRAEADLVAYKTTKWVCRGNFYIEEYFSDVYVIKKITYKMKKSLDNMNFLGYWGWNKGDSIYHYVFYKVMNKHNELDY